MDKRKLGWLFVMMLIMLTLAASALADTYTTLRYRDENDAVKQMQTALNQLGYSTGGIDGKFGPTTEKAVRQFQKNNGLTVDGAAGSKTLTLLYQLVNQGTTSSTTTTTTTTSTTTSSGSGLFGGNYATLEYGSRGDRVTLLQQALNDLGFSAGTADGKFGTGTQRAVVSFQQANGLTADGKAGTKTLTCIENLLLSDTAAVVQSTAAPTTTASTTTTTTTASTSSVPTRTLRKGYTGDDVKSVQTRLKELGYYTGSIDGKYGTGSMAAVKAFQQDNGLTADGLAGTKTYAILFSSNASASSGTSATAAPTATPAATTATTTYTTLRKGSTGDAVTAMQKALAELNYTVNTDGSYTNTTVTAVKTFQQNNGLSVDGIAGPLTLQKLYSGSAVGGSASATTTTTTSTTGVTSAPSKSQIQLLHWVTDVKPSISNGQYLVIYDPATDLSWTLRVMSRGRHCDVEPLTATDTAIQYKAFGNQNTWTPKGVYVKLPDGRWTVATMHNVPHGSQTIKDNNFDGQNCVHFLRDMSEAEQNDPKYGVQNQEVLRTFWKNLTGEEIAYK